MPYLVSDTNDQEVFGGWPMEWREHTQLDVGTSQAREISSTQTSPVENKKEQEQAVMQEKVSQ